MSRLPDLRPEVLSGEQGALYESIAGGPALIVDAAP